MCEYSVNPSDYKTTFANILKEKLDGVESHRKSQIQKRKKSGCCHCSFTGNDPRIGDIAPCPFCSRKLEE